MFNARLRVLLLAAVDAVSLLAVWIGVAYVYKLCGGSYRMSTYWSCWPALAVPLMCNAFSRLYHGNVFVPGAALQPPEEIRRLFWSISLAYLLIFAWLTLTRSNVEYSRLVLLLSWAISTPVVFVARGILRGTLKKFGWIQIPVLIAGGGVTGRQLAESLRTDSFSGFNPVGFLDDNPEVSDRIAPLSDAAAVARQLGVSHLILCLPPETVVREGSRLLRKFPVLEVIPDNRVFPVSWMRVVNLGGLGGVEIENRLLQRSQQFTKRIAEIAVAAVGIVFLLPVLAVLAVLVRFSSPGPVLYRAKRLGRCGRPIEVWKFRTMHADADLRLDELLRANPELAREWERNFKLDNDPRVTFIGRFLRRSSLDELPQLFNVLRGEMALVGPRPIVTAEVSYYGKSYEVMSLVRPGITGLWQVSGRSETSYELRVRLDVSYVMNWSIWLDFYILLKTAVEVLRGRGAV